MDTHDLSREAYNGILLEAEKLTHDLTLHYGVLSGACEDEPDYIDKALEMTNEIMQADDWELDDLFWGNPPDKEMLHFTLKKIISNIESIMNMVKEYIGRIYNPTNTSIKDINISVASAFKYPPNVEISFFK